MNYLAHLFLSGADSEVILGNFIGDSVRGSHFENYSVGIQKGIQLHRAIDTFTDQHPLVHEAKSFFVPEFDKYSGILIDIFFDHFLARNFGMYSSVSLDEFSKSMIQVLAASKEIMPESAIGFYTYMINNNVPQCYAELDGIEMVLRGMTHRIKYRYNLANAIGILVANDVALEAIFRRFFPMLQDFSNDFRNTSSSAR